MKYLVNRKQSETSKRILFYITINGKRISKVNFARKNECEADFRNMVRHYGQDALISWSQK